MDLGAWISALRKSYKTWWADLPPHLREKVSMETVRRAYNGDWISRAKAEPIVEATKGKVELWRLILGSDLEKQARADLLREEADRGVSPPLSPRPRTASGEPHRGRPAAPRSS